MARVLLVEDNRDFRQNLAENLRLRGHEVFEAADADEALARVAQADPQVVVTDIYMRGRPEGLGLLERLPEAGACMPVVVISGEGDFDAGARAKELGAVYVVSKSRLLLKMDEFNAVLSRAAELAQAREPAEVARARARLAIDAGDYLGAARMYEEARDAGAALSADDVQRWALALELAGRQEEAVGLLEASRGLGREVLAELARLYRERGDDLRAADALTDLFEELLPASSRRACEVGEELLAIVDVPEVREKLASLYLRIGDEASAAAHLVALAQSRLRQGLLADAGAAIRKLAALSAVDRDALRALEAAMDEAKRAQALSPAEAGGAAGAALAICTSPACRQEALSAGLAFRYAGAGESCDLCGKGERTGRTAALEGKRIFICGGRFPKRYAERLASVGAECSWHEGAGSLGRIPGLVSAADAVVIITGAGKHEGSAKAELAAKSLGRPVIYVSAIGAGAVLARILEELPERLGNRG